MPSLCVCIHSYWNKNQRSVTRQNNSNSPNSSIKNTCIYWTIYTNNNIHTNNNNNNNIGVRGGSRSGRPDGDTAEAVWPIHDRRALLWRYHPWESEWEVLLPQWCSTPVLLPSQWYTTQCYTTQCYYHLLIHQCHLVHWEHPAMTIQYHYPLFSPTILYTPSTTTQRYYQLYTWCPTPAMSPY